MTVKLLTDYHLEFLSLKEGSTGSSDSTLVKMPHCWKSHDDLIKNIRNPGRDTLSCTFKILSDKIISCLYQILSYLV